MMWWRRGALLVLHPLRRIPYAACSLLVLLLDWGLGPRWPMSIWPAVSVLALLGALALWRGGQLQQGRLRDRRRLEASFAALAVLEVTGRFTLTHIGWPWIPWSVLPFLLFLVYSNFRVRDLAFLFVFHVGYGELGGIHDRKVSAVLLLSTAMALLFRTNERRKREGVADRLRFYEREAGAIALGSEEFQKELRHEERKNEHLATMIQEREAGFKTLLEILHRTLLPHTTALFLFDPVAESFFLKEHLTSSDRFSRRTLFPPHGIFKAIVREKAPIRMTSAAGELRGLLYYDGPPSVRSVAVVPVKSDDMLKGVVALDRLSADGFSDAELEIIQRVAEQLARWIDSSETLHAYFHLKDELTSFYAASSALNRSLRMDDVMQTLLQSARTIVPYDLGMVILYEPQTGSNHVAAATGSEGEGLVGKTFTCSPEKGLISWVIRNQTPLSYGDFRAREGKSPLFHRPGPLPNIYDSVFVVPMQFQTESLGAVLFASEKNHCFSRNERKMLEVVVTQAAISMKNAQMVSKLERLATTDGLTGLKNHRLFQETLAAELERAGRYPTSTSLLFVDIDHFKKFNDEYGHPVGDFVLREVGEILSRAVRKADTVSRYGGEEFAVILVNTASSGALQMADRIVHQVAHTQFQQQGLTLRVTISIGVATAPDDAQTREELIEFADRALYEAKGKGRNRAVTYRPSMGKPDVNQAEKRLVEATEDELRRMVDRAPVSV